MFKIISICKGGGYKYCKTIPKHPNANSNGLYPLHRVLMENKLGRLLNSKEIVHHKDENKSNDNINNLKLIMNKEHARFHRLKDAPPKIKIKCICGKFFKIKPHYYRLRLKRNKTNKIYCSRNCGSIAGHNLRRTVRTGAEEVS